LALVGYLAGFTGADDGVLAAAGFGEGGAEASMQMRLEGEKQGLVHRTVEVASSIIGHRKLPLLHHLRIQIGSIL
jgi:hypothetical protein